MLVITGRNVNHVYPTALFHLQQPSALRRPSRNGPVIEYPTPVTTVYSCPGECVLFDPLRDANPFFHLFEFLWIVAGRDDVAFLHHFVKRIADYSDDGLTFSGSYGARLRGSITSVIDKLRASEDDRRAVAPIYWPSDVAYTGKDLPCNVAAMFKIRNGAVTLTVANRSNDLVYGAYGANVVQFGLLLSYVAAALGRPAGSYYQVSDSLHLYIDDPKSRLVFESARLLTVDPYDSGEAVAMQLWAGNETREDWDRDLAQFFSWWDKGATKDTRPVGFRTAWWNHIASPLWNAYAEYRADKVALALQELDTHPDDLSRPDWIEAGRRWLERKAK